ncbi:MAG: VacJ family lipoprotein, partial [Desulfobacteraceae bacterium 4572_19]
PFLGPSTLRDTVGLAGDIFLYPVSYVKPVTLAYGIQSVDFINRASFRTGEYQLLKDAAISPYEAFRAAYIQYRIALINK